jgi:hypothetical protein
MGGSADACLGQGPALMQRCLLPREAGGTDPAHMLSAGCNLPVYSVGRVVGIGGRVAIDAAEGDRGQGTNRSKVRRPKPSNGSAHPQKPKAPCDVLGHVRCRCSALTFCVGPSGGDRHRPTGSAHSPWRAHRLHLDPVTARRWPAKRPGAQASSPPRIRFHRGWITVTDHRGLGGASCGCYGVLREVCDRLV